MKKFAYFLLLATMAGSCSQCHRGGTQDGPAEDSLTWDSVVVHEEYRPVAYGDSGPVYVIDMVLAAPAGPTGTDSLVNMNICNMIFSRPNTMLRQAAAEYLDTLKHEFDDEMADLYDPADESGFPYSYALDMKGAPVADSRADVVAYVLDTYVFTGGAHGNSLEMFLNMDAATGAVLTADDVFAPGQTGKVVALIEQQLMADNGCTSMDSLRAKTAITMLGDVYVSDHNFLLCADGVRFVFNQYEIAPYAAGKIEVKLTYEQLEGCMKI